MQPQQQGQDRAERTVALTVLARLIRQLDKSDVEDLLYDQYGQNEAWAAQKHLEYQMPDETMDRVRAEMAEALDLVAALAGAKRTEKWKWQFTASGEEMGRQEFGDEASARADFERLCARNWPAPGTVVRDEVYGHELIRSHPDDDPWALALQHITTFTQTVERRDSRHNWPAEPVAANG